MLLIENLNNGISLQQNSLIKISNIINKHMNLFKPKNGKESILHESFTDKFSNNSVEI